VRPAVRVSAHYCSGEQGPDPGQKMVEMNLRACACWLPGAWGAFCDGLIPLDGMKLANAGDHRFPRIRK